MNALDTKLPLKRIKEILKENFSGHEFVFHVKDNHVEGFENYIDVFWSSEIDGTKVKEALKREHLKNRFKYVNNRKNNVHLFKIKQISPEATKAANELPRNLGETKIDHIDKIISRQNPKIISVEIIKYHLG